MDIKKLMFWKHTDKVKVEPKVVGRQHPEEPNHFDYSIAGMIGRKLHDKAKEAEQDWQELGCPNSRAASKIYSKLYDHLQDCIREGDLR